MGHGLPEKETCTAFQRIWITTAGLAPSFERENMHLCPVCGYREMPDPPEDFNICPCCGTEFGYTNAGVTNEQVRAKWLSQNAPWFSPDIQPPADWNPHRQLVEAGFIVGSRR